MPLNLMYITNNPDVAMIAEETGVDRIFIDLEYIGKSDRQGGMDTVQSHHTLSDVQKLASVIHKAEIMVRVNPIHEATTTYCSSKEEIDTAIVNGAQLIMLPYFKTVGEVEQFIRLVDGRAKTFPLLETPEAVDVIDEILDLQGIDQMHIGLNDLSLGYGMKFMFELLADGTVERLCQKIKQHNIPYGFGGIASLGKGLLPSEYVIAEHYRLGSTCAILSRSFCDVNKVRYMDKVKSIFTAGISEIRAYEKMVSEMGEIFFEDNRLAVAQKVAQVVGSIV